MTLSTKSKQSPFVSDFRCILEAVALSKAQFHEPNEKRKPKKPERRPTGYQPLDDASPWLLSSVLNPC
jgi:hypothetical protein